MAQCPWIQVARVVGGASWLVAEVIRYTTSTVFFPALVTVRRSWATWLAPVNCGQPGKVGMSMTLMVRVARLPWPCWGRG